MQSPARQFREFWRHRNLPARAGISANLIAKFEEKHRVLLPNDMRELLTLMDGTEGFSADDLTLWPLQELKPIPDVFTGADYSCLNPQNPQALPNAGSYFVFADWLIYSFCYAIGLGKDVPHGEIVFIDGENWYRCSNSFSAFLGSYMHEAVSPNFCGFLPELVTQ
jgi:hypothetical protein